MYVLKKIPVREFILTVFRSLFLLPVIVPVHSRLDKARSFSLFAECLSLSPGRDELLLIRFRLAVLQLCQRIPDEPELIPTGAEALIRCLENGSVGVTSL
jgi:hypothetical protein